MFGIELNGHQPVFSFKFLRRLPQEGTSLEQVNLLCVQCAPMQMQTSPLPGNVKYYLPEQVVPFLSSVLLLSFGLLIHFERAHAYIVHESHETCHSFTC